MRPHKSWEGALELTINEVPLAVNIELWSRVKDRRNGSGFRSLAPSGLPIKRIDIDPKTGKKFDGPTRKGIEAGPDTFTVMTEDALAKIDEIEKTKTIPAETFCPLESIALDLAINRFAVRPQSDVPGSADALNIVWNGLRARKLAWVSQVSLRGGQDSVLVIYATDAGMWAALLPFEAELYPLPTHEFKVDKKAATNFGKYVDQEQEVAAFDHSAFVSDYKARREAAIQQVLDESDPVTVGPKGTQPKVDLMAGLESLVAKKKAAKKPAPKKKVAA